MHDALGSELGLVAISGLAAAWSWFVLSPALQTGVDRLLGRRLSRLGQLELREDLIRWAWRGWLLAGMGALILLGPGLRMWPVAGIGAGLMALGPPMAIDALIRRRERILRDQLPMACFAVACTVKAGLSLPQAIEHVARESPWPLGSELQRIAADYRRGQPMREALESVANRLQIDTFSMFALAVGVTFKRGGRLAEALGRIAQSVQETQRLERQLETQTASGRRAVQLIAFSPALFLSAMWLVDHQAVYSLLASTSGQVAMASAAALVFVAFRWAARIMRSVS